MNTFDHVLISTSRRYEGVPMAQVNDPLSKMIRWNALASAGREFCYAAALGPYIETIQEMVEKIRQLPCCYRWCFR